MDIDRFTEVADRLVEELPPKLLEGLTGGIVVAEEAHRREDDPPDVYILGEYVTEDWPGCYIVLYYGSFRELFEGEPDEVWEEELRITIRHEVRHHVEARAGMDDLGVEDKLELERLWAEWEAEAAEDEEDEGDR